MTIRERARIALERARAATKLEDNLHSNTCMCDECMALWEQGCLFSEYSGVAIKQDVPALAAHILRITSPGMRERIAERLREFATRLSDEELDAIMALLTEEPCDST